MAQIEQEIKPVSYAYPADNECVGFTAHEADLINSVFVRYSKSSKRFVSSAKLNVDGYILEVPEVHYKTLIGASQGLIKRITEAVLKFKPESK